MRVLLVGGVTGIARLVVALAFLIGAFVAALGSGADDFVQIFGWTQSQAQRVLLATLLFGAVLFWDNATLRKTITAHANTPFLSWAYPHAELRTNGSILIEVQCENTGPVDSVAILRTGRAWTNGTALEMPVQPWSPINSSKIDQQKNRWTVLIHSPANIQYSTGRREVTWNLVYSDSNRPNTHVYLTQASIVVDFEKLGDRGVIKEQWMDATSTREERYERYLNEVKNAKKSITRSADA